MLEAVYLQRTLEICPNSFYCFISYKLNDHLTLCIFTIFLQFQVAQENNGQEFTFSQPSATNGEANNFNF